MSTEQKQPAEQNEPRSPRRLIRGRDEVRDQLAVLAEEARREVALFSPQLDSYFFNNGRFARALASFAARHRHNRARILVEDATQALHDNDRLVALLRRLSDFLDMRQVGEEHQGIRDMFIVIDHGSYLHRQDMSKPECLTNAHDPQEAVNLLRRFNEMWNRSEPVASLRSAGL
jgi:uncharacterized protein YeeX (DUF496 family)